MPPDRAGPGANDLAEGNLDLPLDADLESLDAELSAAGEQARRMLYGRSQPTRLFSNELRARLLSPDEVPAVGPGQGEVIHSAVLQVAADFDLLVRGPVLVPEETPRAHSVPAGDPRVGEVSLRVILALLAIASMMVLLAAGTLAGTFGPALP